MRKGPGMMLATVATPGIIRCKGAKRRPLGREALQVVSGVATTRLQFVRGEGILNRFEFNRIENTPSIFVVAADTTFPVPHRSCTIASTNKKA